MKKIAILLIFLLASTAFAYTTKLYLENEAGESIEVSVGDDGALQILNYGEEEASRVLLSSDVISIASGGVVIIASGGVVTIASGTNALSLDGQEIDVNTTLEQIADSTAVNSSIWGRDASGNFEEKSSLTVDLTLSESTPTTDGLVGKSSNDEIVLGVGGSSTNYFSPTKKVSDSDGDSDVHTLSEAKCNDRYVDYDSLDSVGIILGDESSPTTEGLMGWDPTLNQIEVGDGSATKVFLPIGEDTNYASATTNTGDDAVNTTYDTDGDGSFEDEAWFPSVSGDGAALTFGTMGTQSGNDISVSASISPAANYKVRLWLSDTDGGIQTSTAPDGGDTEADGLRLTDATVFTEHTAEIDYSILTGSDGDFTVTIDDDDDDNDWYLCGEINGSVVCSTIISHAYDVDAPTFSSATLGTDGETYTFLFSENIVIGSGGSTGWYVEWASAGAVGLTYSSGDGTSTLVYTGDTLVSSGDTVADGLDYTQSGDGLEDSSGNDLATFTSESVTNNSTQSGGGTCTAEFTQTTAGTSDYDINDLDGSTNYCGNTITPESTITICQVDFYISYKAGDISSKTFRAYLCTMSGSSLNVMTEADATVTGNNSWSDASLSTGTSVSFEWSSGYEMTAETEYAIVVTMDGSDASNYAELEYSESTAIPSGTARTWDGTKFIVNAEAGNQFKMVIYAND